jgi:AcrB/AcrD/AcrF family
LAEQSVFVRAAVSGVVREAIIAACLTGAMILLFLGSWRSTVIIAVSIPLSILTSVIALSALGETINLMTLGGLALWDVGGDRRRGCRYPGVAQGRASASGRLRANPPDKPAGSVSQCQLLLAARRQSLPRSSTSVCRRLLTS